MAALSCIMVGGIPRGVTRTHLLEHFGSSSNGGGTVEYMLHPLGNDLSMAVIKFVDDKVAACILQHDQVISGVPLQVALLPRQVLAQCQADVDPLIVAGLPDVVACMDLLRSDFGVKVSYDSLLRKMSLQGSFLQIQFAQSALNSIYQQQEEMRQKKLKEATDGVIDLPLKGIEPSLQHLPTRESYNEPRTFSPLSFRSDHFSELESPARTLHVEDLRAALPPKAASLRGEEHGNASPPLSVRSDKSVQEILMEQLNQSMQSNAMSVELRTSRSRQDEDVTSVAPEESPFLRDATTVDDIFASTALKTTSGPRPSESVDADDLLVSGELMSTGGTLGKSDQRVVLEFDSQLFDYMRRIHGQSLKDLEHSYQVQLQYKKSGDKTMVRILPSSSDVSLIAPHQAKNPLINLYKTMVQAVTIRDITLRGITSKGSALMNQVIKKVKEDFRTSVFIDTKDKTKLSLTGDDLQVQKAETYIRNTLDLKKEVEVKPKKEKSLESPSRSDTNRSQDLENKIRQSQSPRSSIHSPRESIRSPRDSARSPRGSVKNPQPEVRRSSKESIHSPREPIKSPRDFNNSARHSITSPRESLKGSRSSIHSPRNSTTSPRQGISEQQKSLNDSHRSSRSGKQSPFQSPRILSPRTSIDSTKSIDGREQRSKSSFVVRSEVAAVASSAPVSDTSPRAAWPTPEPESGVPQMEDPKTSTGVQMSVHTSITGVTALSSQDLSIGDMTGLSTGEIAGLSYMSTGQSLDFGRSTGQSLDLGRSTGQSLDLGRSVELNLSQRSHASDTNNHLSRVSFVSTGASGDLSLLEKDVERFKFVTKEGVKVSVYKGDIASAAVDVIVCPATEDMHLLRDVALKVSSAAGSQLQEKCTEHVVKQGPLKIGGVHALSASGNLQSQYVVCAAGPMWCLYPDKLECETVLKQTFINCLTTANQDLRASSVAFPPISAGELGVPEDVCAWAMLAAIEEFSSTASNNSIKEIHIMSEDAKTTAIIGQTLQEVLVERESAQATPVMSPRTVGSSNAGVHAPFIVRLTAACVKIAERAGIIIREILHKGELGVIEKGVNDLQTEADRSAERCIVASLKAQFPGIVTVGEESGKKTEIEVNPDWIEMGQSEHVLEACKDLSEELCQIVQEDVVVWVDPLDGTSEYTQGLLEHVTTLIGVGVKGVATAGVIHQPFYNHQAAAFVPRGHSIWGIVGVGAFGFEPKEPPHGNVIVTTRSHGSGAVGEAVDACGPTEVIRVGGCGHKVALVLQGKANAYVFASPGCKKWDTAAPEAILHAAGGLLTDIHGNQLEYGEHVQHRNAAGVLATPAGGDHGWYLAQIPASVQETLPVIADKKKLEDPMHKLTSSKNSTTKVIEKAAPFIVQLTAACVCIAERAGAIIRDVLQKGELGIIEKGVNDLQTEADRSAERCIVASLKAQFPGIVTVGEESGKKTEIEVNPDWIEMGQSEHVLEACKDLSEELCQIVQEDVVVWVDPLDGTSEYTQGLLEHVTTLIGVGVKGVATAGVIHQPFYNHQAAAFVPRGHSIWGIVGVGAFGFEQKEPPHGNIIVTTRSHGSGAVGEAVDACGPTEVIRVGGCGHKVVLILQGKANAYVFASPGCKKWDTAAPEAILHAAGGLLTDIHGNQLEYGVNVQRRNAAGVLATPAGACHEWYIEKIPASVQDSLPVVADTKKMDDPMHKLTTTPTSTTAVTETVAPFIAQLTAACVCIAERAGAIIRDVLQKGELGIIEKGVNDLQTEADRSAERCIVASLKAQFPGIVTVGEESGKKTEIEVNPDWIEMGQSEHVLEACKDLSEELCQIVQEDVVVWVDPLDGTSEYMQGLLEHVTTLIGVGVKGVATAGVIHQPFYNHQAAAFVPRGHSIWGIVGVGAFGFERKEPPHGNVIVTTRSHGSGAVGEAVDACGPTEVIRVGGCGHKVVLILQGKANAYVFASPGCKKWDTAAPEAILHAAGGLLTDIHGNQLEYGVNVQRRNAAGVLATPAGACHEWYIEKIPASVQDSLPVVADTKKMDDPMHKLTSQSNQTLTSSTSVDRNGNIADIIRQPEKGEMTFEVDRKIRLPGHSGTATIVITYSFPAGQQKEGHPKPGTPYEGATFTAYLPNTQDGRHVLQLLRQAFDLGMTFTVHHSILGEDDLGKITWAGIPHKTSIDGGIERNGYPDEGYVDTLRTILQAKGLNAEPPRPSDG